MNIPFPRRRTAVQPKNTPFTTVKVTAGISRKMFDDLRFALDNRVTMEVLDSLVIPATVAKKKMNISGNLPAASDNVYVHAEFGINWFETMKYTQWDKLVVGQKLLALLERHKDKTTSAIEFVKFG